MAPNLLGNYLEDERSCLIHGITYTEALTKACRESINAESKEEQWKQVECLRFDRSGGSIRRKWENRSTMF